MSEHDIPRHEISVWNEAPARPGLVVVPKLLDVGRNPEMDAVSFVASGAGDVEIAKRVELRPLLW